MKKTAILSAFILITVIANSQVRQRSNTEGFNVAISGHTLGWTSTYFKVVDDNAGTGYGGGILVGYGITQLIEPFLGVDATTMSIGNVDVQKFTMTHVDFGVRFNLGGTILPVRPFVEGGYSYRKGNFTQISVPPAGAHADADFSGGTPNLGGGVHYFFKKAISIFASGLFTLGKKSNLTIGGTKNTDKPDVTTFRIGLGVNINISELMKDK